MGSDSLFQEETMAPLEKACTLIHVWVGMGALEGDSNTIKTVQYLQGLMQPEQLENTSADPQKRRFYFIDDLEALAADAGANLMDYSYAEDATTTDAYGVVTSAFDGEAYGVTYDAEESDYETSAAAYDAVSTTAGTPGVPDYKCCGIGFGATKYDANSQACCEDGSIQASEADCFL